MVIVCPMPDSDLTSEEQSDAGVLGVSSLLSCFLKNCWIDIKDLIEQWKARKI